jgi:hypothetical protein
LTGRRLLFSGVLLGLMALLVVLGGTDTTYAGTFNPEMRFCFDDFSTLDPNPTQPGDEGECDGDNSAGAASTFALGFDVPTGDVNFAAIVIYLPNEWTITPGDEFPIGTRVGLLEAIATIGIINGPCDSTLNLLGQTAGFELYNASLDESDTITFDEEAGGDDEYRQDWAEDLDGNGLIEAVDKYPDFIGRIIDDEEGNPQHPFRRSAGSLIIAGADVLIQYVVYEPGTFIDKNLPNDPALGYPSVVLLQNAGDPDVVPEPNPITDFCTPLGATTSNFGTGDACVSVVNDDPDDDDLVNDGCVTFGTPESEAETSDGSDPCANNVDDDMLDDLEFSRGTGRGEEARINDGCPQAGDTSEADIEYVLYRSPQEEGNYTITTIAFAQPDADGDGYENYLDTCPFDTNVGDPRIKGDGDLDEDGLDAACDPNDDPDAGGLNSDQDLDGYVNRQDNCPLIINGEDDLDPDGVPLNQEDEDVDEDGDRMIDLIGDVCDPEPLVFNGEPLEERIRTLEIDVEIGPPGEGQGPTDGDDDDDGGGGAGVIIVIIVVIAAVVIVGGGAFYLMRRRGA